MFNIGLLYEPYSTLSKLSSKSEDNSVMLSCKSICRYIVGMDREERVRDNGKKHSAPLSYNHALFEDLLQ